MADVHAAGFPIINGLGLGILKQILAQILDKGEAQMEKKVARNLHTGNHDLPPDPTFADRHAFLRHAVRQYFKVILQSGTVADLGRDLLVPKLQDVEAQLVAGTTTQQGAHIVGEALVGLIKALVGSL